MEHAKKISTQNISLWMGGQGFKSIKLCTANFFSKLVM